MNTENKCMDCFDAVCKDSKLLLGGQWRIGEDARRHWRQLYSSQGVCGKWVMADGGKRRLFQAR